MPRTGGPGDLTMSETGFLSRRSAWIKRLADQVAQEIEAEVRSGALGPGATLPDVSELMSRHVTSAGVVEHALGQLEAEGLIERTEDAAWRVPTAPLPVGRFEIPDNDGRTIGDAIAIVELRIGVESESAALAAERRSDEHMLAIEAAAREFEDAAESRADIARADLAFHLTIAQAAGNAYIHDLLGYLGPLLIPRTRVIFSRDAEVDRGTYLEASIREHRDIVAAIRDRDPGRAMTAMRRHLERSRGDLTGIEAAIAEPSARDALA